MIVAVDGPVAAGKGTLARRLAERFGFAYLDTGMLYRAVAARILREGGDPSDPEIAEAAAKALTEDDRRAPDLREQSVGEAASEVAAIQGVRDALLGLQRRFAHAPPGGAPGAVLDGRDIGTVVCPDADVKLFVTASPEVRARRRYEELRARGVAIDYAAVLADVRRRDARDRKRAVAPLRPAPDAHLLDTTNLDIEGAFQRACDIVAQSR